MLLFSLQPKEQEIEQKSYISGSKETTFLLITK